MSSLEKPLNTQESPPRRSHSAESTSSFDEESRRNTVDEKKGQHQTTTEETKPQTPEDGHLCAEPPAPQEDAYEHYKPKTLKFWLIMFSTFVSMLLVALDRTIISTAIPRITDEFNSLGDIGWYGSAYMLTTAACQLLWGRVYRFYDLRWSFLSTIVLFEAGSALCGAAPSSKAFIVGRALAGLGAAGITTGAMMTIIPMVPLHKRPMYQSLFGMVFGVSSVSGPLIGGAFTQNATWRWCFYMNLPVGAVAFACLFFFFESPARPKDTASLRDQILRLDPLGTFFFVPSTVSLLLALQWGGSTYSWGNWRIILLFVMFGLCGIAFAVVQVLMPESASLPLRVIGRRSVYSGALYMWFVSGAMMLTVFYIPLWFQTTHNVDPIKSGVYTIPLVLSLVVGSLISGAVTQKTGYYMPTMLMSPCILSIGLGLLTTFKPNTGSPHWIGYQFLVGFGIGCGFQTVNLAVQAILPKEDIATGVSINFFMQQLGGAVFVSVGQTILSSILVSKLSHIPGLDALTIVQSGATNLHTVVPAQFISAVVKAYNFACTRIFLAALVLTAFQLLSAFGVEWKNIKKNKPQKPAA